jgi:hypothetical protein
LEKGEIAVLTLQFAALFLAVIVIGNFLSIGTQSSPDFTTVYWGLPERGDIIPKGGVLKVDSNTSNIFAYFRLSPSTSITSVSALRFCTDSKSGESRIFDAIKFDLDKTRNENYLVISSTEQAAGWSCTYNIQITDSLGQVLRWTGTVLL